MKNAFLIIIVLCSQSIILAQSQKIPISVGYFGHVLVQPGVKVGTSFKLKQWEPSHTSNLSKQTLFISPQVAFFTWLGVHQSFLLNIDIGYRRQKEGRKSYSAFSLGTAYLLQRDLLSVKSALGDGGILGSNWEASSFFMPTINYEFGRHIHDHLSWYTKYSYGFQLAPNKTSQAVFFVEVGINIH